MSGYHVYKELSLLTLLLIFNPMQQTDNNFNILTKMVYFAQTKLQDGDLIGAKMIIDSVTKQINLNQHSENP